MPPDGSDVRVGRDDVDVVRLDAHAVLGLADRHRRRLGQRLGEEARVRRIEVLDEHERHPGVGRERAEQLRERLEPAGRGADADDGKRHVRTNQEESAASPPAPVSSTSQPPRHASRPGEPPTGRPFDGLCQTTRVQRPRRPRRGPTGHQGAPLAAKSTRLTRHQRKSSWNEFSTGDRPVMCMRTFHGRRSSRARSLRFGGEVATSQEVEPRAPPLEALEMALALRVPEPDLVHHSDRGSWPAPEGRRPRPRATPGTMPVRAAGCWCLTRRPPRSSPLGVRSRCSSTTWAASQYLWEHPPRPGALAYVADHCIGAWVPANVASFVLQPRASTPSAPTSSRTGIRARRTPIPSRRACSRRCRLGTAFIGRGSEVQNLLRAHVGQASWRPRPRAG